MLLDHRRGRRKEDVQPLPRRRTSTCGCDEGWWPAPSVVVAAVEWTEGGLVEGDDVDEKLDIVK